MTRDEQVTQAMHRMRRGVPRPTDGALLCAEIDRLRRALDHG